LLKVIIFIFHNLEKVPVCRTSAFHYRKALPFRDNQEHVYHWIMQLIRPF